MSGEFLSRGVILLMPWYICAGGGGIAPEKGRAEFWVSLEFVSLRFPSVIVLSVSWVERSVSYSFAYSGEEGEGVQVSTGVDLGFTRYSKFVGPDEVALLSVEFLVGWSYDSSSIGSPDRFLEGLVRSIIFWEGTVSSKISFSSSEPHRLRRSDGTCWCEGDSAIDEFVGS